MLSDILLKLHNQADEFEAQCDQILFKYGFVRGYWSRKKEIEEYGIASQKMHDKMFDDHDPEATADYNEYIHLTKEAMWKRTESMVIGMMMKGHDQETINKYLNYRPETNWSYLLNS